jgi:hypothetical protein
VLLEQVVEGQDRCLIMDPFDDQVDASKAAHGGQYAKGSLMSPTTSMKCWRWEA